MNLKGVGSIVGDINIQYPEMILWTISVMKVEINKPLSHVLHYHSLPVTNDAL